MTDCFALLDEPRRPWLDPHALKQKFLSLSAELHPDRIHFGNNQEKSQAQERYVAFNAAYQCLADPKLRLRHLIELESGAKPQEIQQIPEDLMDLFMAVGQLTRKIDLFLKRKTAADSPLLRLQLFEENQALTDELASLQTSVAKKYEGVLAHLNILEKSWDTLKSAPTSHRSQLQELEEDYRLLSYFARWTSQLQERLVQLAL